MLRIFTISLCAYTLYTRQFPLIFFMWDYFYVFMCVGDVALGEVSNSCVKRRSLIFT